MGCHKCFSLNCNILYSSNEEKKVANILDVIFMRTSADTHTQTPYMSSASLYGVNGSNVRNYICV